MDDDLIVTATEDGNVFHNALGQHQPQIPLTLIEIDAIPPSQPVLFAPEVVSRFQGREALWQTPHGDGTLFEAAEAIINGPETPAMYRRAWADLQEFRRDSEMLAAIAQLLDLTTSDLDNLFVLAASISA
ncbi:hypothetical protein [Achromobacter agilis]|uniref:hypothetical protein n=1 Tax=Achromobacter agilis TaxID=1353888 RepID=UPI001ABF9FD7|nr:hypothetical protein [Achromobacter agilis]